MTALLKREENGKIREKLKIMYYCSVCSTSPHVSVRYVVCCRWPHERGDRVKAKQEMRKSLCSEHVKLSTGQFQRCNS